MNTEITDKTVRRSAPQPECVGARQRLLSGKHDPFLIACWERVVFLHYLIRPELLRPHVPEPLELDLYDDMGIISVVAVTMRNFRASRSISTGWMFRPVRSERFLNLRACVHLREEPGAFILWSWLSNPLRTTLPLMKLGFPCTFAEVEFDHRFETGKLQGSVKMKNSSGDSFEYRASLDSSLGFVPCPAGSLAEFAMERYTGFFSRGSRQRLFRCWHPPWLQTIARCAKPPAVWLNASTATIYKHSLSRPMDEATGEIAPTPEAKDAFSVEVACEWEKTLAAARTPNTRKIALRTAMVFGKAKGSVFDVLRRLVRLGLGGKMADGNQFVSWIHEEDFCRSIAWLLEKRELTGAVNICAPHPLPNREMMSAIRQVCGVPFGLPAARWMLELGAVFLRTETELIIKSRRVVPGRLLASGFSFHFPSLSEAFQNLSAGHSDAEAIKCFSR